ncbi:MAG: hypothetical protein J0I39_06535 [Sphingomonas sp.]|nr:hypothetical protein [Sphingomonas sp.]
MNQSFIPAAKNGFSIAAFSAFGHFEGVREQEYQNLSAKWTSLCQELFLEFGGVFDYTWSGNLSHIRTKFTSDQGVGICTIFVNDRTASSILLMNGENVSVEKDVSKIFIRSLHTPLLNTPEGRAENGFSEIESISDRPLMIVVPFPSNEISTQNHEIVRELGWHMAAAYLQE